MQRKRIELLRSSLDDLNRSSVTLLDGELCLVSSDDTGYSSIVIGDGETRVSDLPRVVLNRSGASGFMGIADPKTNPGIPMDSVFYVAKTPGEYGYFGGIELKLGEVALLVWKYESWTKITLLEGAVNTDGIIEELRDIKERAIFGVKIGGKEIEADKGIIEIPVDDKLNINSTNPIQNKAVSEVLDWYEGE